MNTDLITIEGQVGEGEHRGRDRRSGAEFAPGASDAGNDFGGGANEIEWIINLGRGKADGLNLVGDGDPNYFNVGTDGIIPNASGGMTLEPVPDADIDLRGRRRSGHRAEQWRRRPGRLG